MDVAEDFSPYRADVKLICRETNSPYLKYGFVCVVTGAEQPVGQAIVQELAGLVYQLHIIITTASLNLYKDLLGKVGQEFPNCTVFPYPFHVAKEDDTLVLIDEVLNAFGRLDVWVCSSGLLGPPSIEATTPDDL
ncbi:hypothetical protein AAE478_000910 [Parahypoxylon ruwenzoriense]